MFLLNKQKYNLSKYYDFIFLNNSGIS